VIHVGLNLVFLVPGETGGMETYARELIPRLAATEELRLTAFVNRETGADGLAGVPAAVVPVNARNRIEWVRGEQQHLPRMAAAAGCDLIHSLASTAPVWGRVPRVTTIHDLNYRKVPDAHFGVRGLGMRVLVPAAARRSRRVIVDAASTKEDLIADLRVPAERIEVVPLAATPPPPVPLPAPAGRPTVLSVSAKRPHKNLERLVRAVAAIPAERRPRLVVPGYPTPHEAELRDLTRTLGIEADVDWPGWIDGVELERLYAAATCMVFPSLYEGFGLPVLEAMARGVPVATSGRASLAEVAGDAALLFDPEDVDAIRAAIEQLVSDEAERRRLAVAGRERAAAFTWERTAELTAAVYRRALA
jgi:glycosyltransferase involved in cell wall biosynthesis